MSDLVDTHCHIHWTDFPVDIAEVEQAAHAAGVTRMICVGTESANSRRAVEFVQERAGYWASIGVHPNDQAVTAEVMAELRELAAQPKVVAVGECGLDYFYQHLPRRTQQDGLRLQLQLALERDLPVIFHVRDAFDDFWPVFDEFAAQASAKGKTLRGVLHSFTGTQANADKALERGLSIGINGIITFTKNDWQLDIARNLPLNKILLETDAPFLTPEPHRGKVNVPAYIELIAAFMSSLRHQPPEEFAVATTANARKLFKLS